MAYVIAEPCSSEKDGGCVAVCPMDCIHGGTVVVSGVVHDQLFIDPAQCISCGLCVSQCPVDAISSEDFIPDQWRPYIAINAEFYRTGRRERVE